MLLRPVRKFNGRKFLTRKFPELRYNIMYYSTERGDVFAWGLNQHGQCGVGEFVKSPHIKKKENFKLLPPNDWIVNVYCPLRVEGIPPVTEVHCGWSHTVAVTAGIYVYVERERERQRERERERQRERERERERERGGGGGGERERERNNNLCCVFLSVQRQLANTFDDLHVHNKFI